MIRIFLTGPESTGKSVLTKALAEHYGVPYIDEYAREYLELLDRPYNYNDVLHIALNQVESLKKYSNTRYEMIFVDTYLIITKFWFDLVYNNYPEWIDTEIAKTRNDLYLLCKPDIPWKPDPLRENGGEMRTVLFNLYEQELIGAGLNYLYIEGKRENRIMDAIKKTDGYLILKNKNGK
ncbi:MAG: ATP-binding protein [Bacteroidales bacterium]|nr:ATP-binding protein [Bacteroidales bacterium]